MVNTGANPFDPNSGWYTANIGFNENYIAGLFDSKYNQTYASRVPMN